MRPNIKADIFMSILVATIPSHVSQAEETTFDPYAIPRDKSILGHCRQTALDEHPGQVKTLRTHNTAEGFHYEFEIEAQDRTSWIVICEGASQKLIRNQQKK